MLGELGWYRMINLWQQWLRISAFCIGCFCGQYVILADSDVDFETQIAPVLRQSCVACHSDSNKKGEVSLATFEDLRENGYVIPGNAKESYLIELVTGLDGEPPEMPKDKKPLKEIEVNLLRRWIDEGAKWPEHVVIKEKPKADASWWSLQPIADVDPDASIDDFIRRKLNEQNLRLNPPADRRTLIRRAFYDLIGLPPTPSEVDAFVDDPDPLAFQKLIDRLLASHHYGERWGRHWLDVVRFGESIGYERNVIVNNAWPFRDYVIRSMNEDKPFDQFIREHIAGDVLGVDDPNVSVGSTFLVAGPYDDVGNQDAAQAAQIRANTLDEIIRATSDAFLGFTIGCARCHDHKFDPITQKDYYSLYATFAAVRHGSATLASSESVASRNAMLSPLSEQKVKLEQELDAVRSEILKRAKARQDEYEANWTRPAVDRTGTEERFKPATAKFVRLVCESQDSDAARATGFGIDEFEVWTHEAEPRNVALASNGGKAFGTARSIEDFPGAYGPQLAIDGKTGARFIAAGTDLTIEFAKSSSIDRVVFSSAKGQSTPEQGKFVFVAEYRIEISDDGKTWREVANGHDRRPVNRGQHLERRLMQLETRDSDRAAIKRLQKRVASIQREIRSIPALPTAWIGTRSADDAKGPFHVFIGGNPQKNGEPVVPASLSVLQSTHAQYQLPDGAPESQRRVALADWLVHADNPLTSRVLANRLWHYHFGTGIVDTPSDFGYMGGKPSHPMLLDFLASKLQSNGWRIKDLHRMIMLSDVYQQSSEFRADGAKIDGDSRLLWRFPPRRLSAEEIRDTVLYVSGCLRTEPDHGPGFRLYHFMQDNVCTYVPLEKHGQETFRRAVFHQNARASVVDLLTDFDQPDCTFSAPRRAATTTPLQALTMLNHSFTTDMADAMAKRLASDQGNDHSDQVRHAFRLCYSRLPSEDELEACCELMDDHGLAALCRVLLNTSEMIHVR